jgi:hypothetical protein
MPIDNFLHHCDAHSGFRRLFVLHCGTAHSSEGENNERFALVVSVSNLKYRSGSLVALKDEVSSALPEDLT